MLFLNLVFYDNLKIQIAIFVKVMGLLYFRPLFDSHVADTAIL
jgi:hypothetical protein